MKRITFFHKQRKSFKKEKYLPLNNFNNRNTITKTRFSCQNLAINTTKWYNLQQDMKIYENYKRKEKENKTYMIFSSDKYDNIRRKTFSDIEVDNINFQTGNNIEKPKLFFVEDSLEGSLN